MRFAMELLRIEGLTKRFVPTEPAAVDGLELTVDKGEILALLGPSGCGKTTTLRLIAGFEVPDSGMVVLGGKALTGGGIFVPPERRGVGIVFQDYALFPHLTVEQNVAFGLRRLEAARKRERTREIIETVGLRSFSKRYPHELSGGQAQRVALARALAPRPAILLLDEPLVSLDAPLKDEMIFELKEIQRHLGVTTLYITHDQAEAMAVADRLAVMREGRLEQVGSPEAVYRHPRSRFVASFLGKVTLVEGVARAGRVETPLGSFEAPGAEGRVTLAVRPEDLMIDEAGPLRGRLVERLFLGREGVSYLVEASGLRLRCPGPPNGMRPPQVGEEVGLSVVRPPVALED